MNIFRTDRLRLKLRVMNDEDLWWVFLNHLKYLRNSRFEMVSRVHLFDHSLVTLQ
jgi:hypothetical protein